MGSRNDKSAVALHDVLETKWVIVYGKNVITVIYLKYSELAQGLDAGTEKWRGAPRYTRKIRGYRLMPKSLKKRMLLNISILSSHRSPWTCRKKKG